MTEHELLNAYETQLLKAIKSAIKGKVILDGYYFSDTLSLFMYRNQTRDEKLYVTEIDMMIEQFTDESDTIDVSEEQIAAYVYRLIQKSGAKIDPDGMLSDGCIPYGEDGADTVNAAMCDMDGIEQIEDYISVDLDDLIYDIPGEDDDDLRIEREDLLCAILPEYISNCVMND